MPTAPLRNRALALAMKLDHPAYDCFYLALAETEQVQMVTTDEHFIRKVQAAGQHRGKLVHLAELQV